MFLQTTDHFTISFWLRLETDSSSAYILSFELGRSRYFSLYDSSRTRMILYYYRDVLPGLMAINDDGRNTQVALSFYYNLTELPNGIRDNQWHFIALTVNFPSLTLLIDGVQYQPTRGNYQNQFQSRVNLNQIPGTNYTMPAPILTKDTSQINSIVARIGGSIRSNTFSIDGEMRQLVITNALDNELYACIASCNNIIGIDPTMSFPDFVTFYNPVTRTFDFTGPSDAAGYTEFLQSLIYFTNGFLQPQESGERRVITLRVNDERGLGTETQISVIGRSNQNNPLLDANGDLVADINFAVDFREDIDTETEILSPRSFITDTDIDSVIVSVTVNLTNAQNGDDETIRLLDNPPSLVNVTGSDGEALRAQGSSKIIFIDSIDPLRATANVFITALLSLRYINTAEEPMDIDRIIQFTVFDGLRVNTPRAQTTVNILTTDDVPQVDLNGIAGGFNERIMYVESSPPMALASNLLIIDPDSRQLTEANIRIDTIFDEGNESISLDTSNLIAGLICVPATCNGTEITITGSTSLPVYQRLLRTLQYVNLKTSIDLPSLRDRMVFVTINDGVNSSDPQANIVIDFIPLNPRVIIELNAPSQNYSTIFIEGQTEPIPCHSLVRAVDTSIDTLASIVVSIRDVLPEGVTESGESISITTTEDLDISIEINTALKRITFSQVDSISQYLEAVRRIQYINTEPEPILVNRFVDFLVIPGGGAPSDTAVCNITVMGVNDNAPSCPTVNHINIPENSTNGYEITQLEATDIDRGVDGVLRYQLIEGDFSIFEISEDGLLRLTRDMALDRESIAEYQLAVEACDGGTPQLCCRFNLTLMVDDINDNPPIFNSSSYNFQFGENIVADFTTVFDISDEDEGINSQLAHVEIDIGSFSVRAGCFDRFSVRIEAHNQVILSTTPPGLDYEIARECSFQVVAYDAGVPSLSSRTNVTIEVINEDDFPPEFRLDFYNLIVEEENAFPLALGRVEATDRDSSKNLSFSQSGGMSLFEVNETTGIISILFTTDRDNATQYDFVAIVTDPGGRNDTTLVRISVIPINNDPPVLDLNITDIDSRDALTPFLFIEEGAPVRIVTEPFVSDRDELDLTITHITVQIVNSGNPSRESLSVANDQDTPPHTLLESGASGKLTIQPQNIASPPDIHRLLQSVVYNNNEDELSECQSDLYPCENGPLSRTILYSVFDSRFFSNVSAAFVIFQLVNDPPSVNLDGTVSNMNYNTNFREGTDGVTIVNSDSYSISDEDSLNLLSLTCNLTNPLDFDEDSLSIRGPLPLGLTATIATSHMIHISGNSNISNYETALGLIQYSSTSDNPDTTSRHIEVHVTDDGNLMSNIAITTISFSTSNDPPTLNLDSTSPGVGFSTSYVENGAAVPLSRLPVINDVDSTNLQSLVVTIRGGSGGEDVLSPRQTLISSPLTFSYVYPELTVMGSASLSTYEAIIASLQYENTADEIANVTTRLVDFVITDDNGGVNAAVTTAINIIPVDDNPPIFLPSNIYNFSVNESSPRMHLVDTLITVDADLPPGQDVPTFNIISADPIFGFSDFFIRNNPANSFQGQIFVNGPIDYDMRTQVYVLTVEAESSGRTANATVYINVVNLPDISPEFLQCSPIYSVVENDPFSTPLTPSSCTAIDPDRLDAIQYAIEDNENAGLITIDPRTGDLTVVDTINREMIGVEFSVTIIASDSTQFTSRNITVEIQGENEFNPVFSQSSYILNIEENTVVEGQPLVQVTATDQDEQPDIMAYTDFVSRIAFSIVSVQPPSREQYFSINSTSGEIIQLLAIDFEMFRGFDLIVAADDNDATTVPRTSSVQVIINVMNVNDELPQFVNLPNPIRVNENTPIREQIVVINTFDPDINAFLSVSFVPHAPSQFLLTSVSGILSVSQNLDAELSPRAFNVTLQLVDMNTDSRYADFSTVFANTTIVIDDINDNIPFFGANEYFGMVLEHSAGGVTVLNVNATDEDYGVDHNGIPNGNNLLTYSFLSSDSPPPNTFSIDRHTGAITTQPLDREVASEYRFTVMVQDNPTEQGEPIHVDTALVTIIIEDINEFPPILDPDTYFAFVPESAQPGEQISTYARVAWNISCE